MKRMIWWLIPVLLVVSWWAINTGRLALLLLWAAAFLGAKDDGVRREREKADRQTEKIEADFSHYDEVVERHEKEVRDVEEADYSGAPDDELLAHANERERRRPNPVDS